MFFYFSVVPVKCTYSLHRPSVSSQTLDYCVSNLHVLMFFYFSVVPVKCTYSLRRPSVSSVVSGEDHAAVEPSNSKPVSQSEGW